MLPTDMALIEDEKFLPYVKKCTSLVSLLFLWHGGREACSGERGGRGGGAQICERTPD